ncbi:pentapeptide repeat-containing protein [Roseivirga sp.]|uniref:pentapeptide repeat-containing protein n=1 Tax=Roseivirga sp. TaxID=1964215 RepID=UPI003B5181B8
MQKQQLLKTTLLTLLFCLFATSAKAQTTVNASDIMAAIKKGEDINYTNVTVVGKLDLTFMEEKLPDLPVRRKWWRDGGDNTVNELVESKISFVNCTFEDDVIAYYHDNRSEYTFTADFERDVRFEKCQFKRDAMFKYSNFEGEAIFAGSTFDDETTFKYAEFEYKADFSNTLFDEDAIFKYTKFRDGASFKAAKFERSLDMKYTKVRGDFDLKDMEVRWDIITKYAEVNGRSFSRYLLDN